MGNTTTATEQQWLDTRARFIEAGGNATQSFGFGRVIGQIYALLYLSPAPLCLDKIASELAVSKASVSTTIRQLESLGAAHRIWVKGDRKDYYEAETDFKKLFRNGLLDKIRRKLDGANFHLNIVDETVSSAKKKVGIAKKADYDVIAQRVQYAKDVHTKLNALLNNPLLDQIL
jgi:DNA-binding transcriptional regulator GbsR (MarR family)